VDHRLWQTVSNVEWQKRQKELQREIKSEMERQVREKKLKAETNKVIHDREGKQTEERACLLERRKMTE